MEDTSDPDIFSFNPEPSDNKPYNFPILKKDILPKSKLNIPVDVEKKKEKKAPATSSKPKTSVNDKPQPVEKVKPIKPSIVEKDEEPPENFSK